MKFRLSIGTKLWSGFISLVLLTAGAFFFTESILTNGIKLNEDVQTLYNPSVEELRELRFEILKSQMLISNWTNTPRDDDPDKISLNRLAEKRYPLLEKKIDYQSQHWDSTSQRKWGEIKLGITDLFGLHDIVKGMLSTFEDYNDPEQQFMANFYVEQGGEIHNKTHLILYQLESLIDAQNKIATQKTDDTNVSFSKLKNYLIILGAALFLIGAGVAALTTNSIVKPIQKLKLMLLDLGKGIFPNEEIQPGNDEIGEMTIAMNKVVEGMKRTKDFAYEVGSGNFDATFQPLSDQDNLGKTLLKMRDDLAINEKILEDKVKQRTAEVVKQKEEIEEKSQQIRELYAEVTDSIHYAKRIQDAILPPNSIVESLIPDFFILYKPKDIVSGDFYWVEGKGNKVYFAAVDCTGHGVPGAMVSVIGYNNLNQALANTKNANPAKILDGLNKGVSKTFHQEDGAGTTKDGMDIALCSINFEAKELEYAGAFNPLYIVRNGELLETKADKFPVGSFGEVPQSFTNNKISLIKGDVIYVFSDGYADQFGGPKGKKLMLKSFRSLLIENYSKPMEEQKNILDKYVKEWRGELEQVDDILVIGVRV